MNSKWGGLITVANQRRSNTVPELRDFPVTGLICNFD
jgi:hypothetical protein